MPARIQIRSEDGPVAAPRGESPGTYWASLDQFCQYPGNVS